MPSLFNDSPQDSTPTPTPTPIPTPTRVCPHCSTQSETTGDFCPHCGKSLVRRRRGLGKRAKLLIAALVLVVLAGGASTAVAMKIQHQNAVKAEHDRQQRIAQQKREARERRERARIAEQERQDALDEIERDSRSDLEKSLRKAITKDARRLVSSGLLDGPILKAVCDPVGGGRDDLDAHTGRYDCMAVHTEASDGTMRGYTYSGTINYDEFSYSWKLGG
jgi:hypothetical protein